MIHDLDETLRGLLQRELPSPLDEQVAISFDPPDDQFPPTRVTLPAIDLFLYDVRENLELRTNEWSVQRNSDGSAMRRRPPTRVDCSYLITAWPSESTPNPAQDEHMLLGEVMIALLRYPSLERDFLRGRLSNQDLPLPTTVLQPGHLQSMGEFWQALGGKPKSALNYKVTIAVQPFDSVDLPLVVESDAAVKPIVETPA